MVFLTLAWFTVLITKCPKGRDMRSQMKRSLMKSSLRICNVVQNHQDMSHGIPRNILICFPHSQHQGETIMSYSTSTSLTYIKNRRTTLTVNTEVHLLMDGCLCREADEQPLGMPLWWHWLRWIYHGFTLTNWIYWTPKQLWIFQSSTHASVNLPISLHDSHTQRKLHLPTECSQHIDIQLFAIQDWKVQTHFLIIRKAILRQLYNCI